MSRAQIERRIRSLFAFLFGVIFTFLFILTSGYLDIIEREDIRRKEQLRKFLVEAVVVREKFFFEEFMTKNYNSLDSRVSVFLKDLGINRYDLVIFDGLNCMRGSERDCKNVDQISKKHRPDSVQSFISLGNVYLLSPIVAWGEKVGNVSIIIPTKEISNQMDVFDKLLFHVIPFIFLIFLTFLIYKFTEKNIIKPTIDRIIDSEKAEAEKILVRQFAHDIQSPIVALETVLELSDDFPNDSRELISSALDRISGISKELLLRGKENKRNKTLGETIENIISDKMLEYKSINLIIQKDISQECDSLIVNGFQLYRNLSNLINNSIQASLTKGDQEVMINLKVAVNDLQVDFLIEDRGVGICSSKISLILEGKYTDKVFGNGMGVSGAKRWVDYCEGKFFLSSKLDIGTQINFTLPIHNKNVFLC